MPDETHIHKYYGVKDNAVCDMMIAHKSGIMNIRHSGSNNGIFAVGARASLNSTGTILWARGLDSRAIYIEFIELIWNW